MTRPCFALSVLMAMLGGTLMLANTACCQVLDDYHGFGSVYNTVCPFADEQANIEKGENQQQTPAVQDNLAESSENLDIRGRAVVAVIDDPADAGDDNNASVADRGDDYDSTIYDDPEESQLQDEYWDCDNTEADAEPAMTDEEAVDEYDPYDGEYSDQYDAEYEDASNDYGYESEEEAWQDDAADQVEESQDQADDYGYDYEYEYEYEPTSCSTSDTPATDVTEADIRQFIDSCRQAIEVTLMNPIEITARDQVDQLSQLITQALDRVKIDSMRANVLAAINAVTAPVIDFHTNANLFVFEFDVEQDINLAKAPSDQSASEATQR